VGKDIGACTHQERLGDVLALQQVLERLGISRTESVEGLLKACNVTAQHVQDGNNRAPQGDARLFVNESTICVIAILRLYSDIFNQLYFILTKAPSPEMTQTVKQHFMRYRAICNTKLAFVTSSKLVFARS